MTCTHAALIRRRLVELGFKYDNMVMEESAQILEVETFIPMMLQVCTVCFTMGWGLFFVFFPKTHTYLPFALLEMHKWEYSL